jgi:hypothetical protein
LGDVLIYYQKVQNVNDLISKETIIDIKNGTLDQLNFPNYSTIVKNETSINEKLVSLNSMAEIGNVISSTNTEDWSSVHSDLLVIQN